MLYCHHRVQSAFMWSIDYYCTINQLALISCWFSFYFFIIIIIKTLTDILEFRLLENIRMKMFLTINISGMNKIIGLEMHSLLIL